MALHQRSKRIFGVVAFFAIGLLLLQFADQVLRPNQTTGIMSDKAKSFYEEPGNTIEVLFLGPSTTGDGFNPIQLWEEQGICSYNLGTSMQPILTSYCLAKEAYRLHPQTLKTIVLDCSVLRYEPSDFFYRLPLDEITLTSKIYPVSEWDPEDEDKDRLVYLSSLYAYHNRWSSLEPQDWSKPLWIPHRYLRGYEPNWMTCLVDAYPAKPSIPRFSPDASVEPSSLDAEEARSFDELAAFCKSREIALVLAKTPIFGDWTDADHAAVQNLASERGVDFIDLNYDPFISESLYNQLTDTRDGKHANNRGAAKITGYVGEYLRDRGLAEDRRGDPAYDFMDDQAALSRVVTDDTAELRAVTEPVDYLAQAMADPDYTVFVAVDGTGSGDLSAEQRRRLEAMGLGWMASLREGQCYRAVLKDGKVIDEELSDRADTRVYISYGQDDYVLPRHAYFRMFKSSDREAIDALAYETDAEEFGERPEWTIPDKGVSVVVYDDSVDAVVDAGTFRSLMGLRRYEDPERSLRERLDAGAEDWQIVWHLEQLKLYDERYAEALAARNAPVAEAPVSEAPVPDASISDTYESDTHESDVYDSDTYDSDVYESDDYESDTYDS